MMFEIGHGEMAQSKIWPTKNCSKTAKFCPIICSVNVIENRFVFKKYLYTFFFESFYQVLTSLPFCHWQF